MTDAGRDGPLRARGLARRGGAIAPPLSAAPRVLSGPAWVGFARGARGGLQRELLLPDRDRRRRGPVGELRERPLDLGRREGGPDLLDGDLGGLGAQRERDREALLG